MTTSEPSPGTEKTGRHAHSESEEDEPQPDQADSPTDDPAPEDAPDEASAEASDEVPDGTAEKPAATADGRADDGAAARADEHADRPRRSRSRFSFRPGGGSPLGRHPAGASLLSAAGLLLGLFVAPTVFDQLDFDVFDRAARSARSAATTWPSGGEPWFWPTWVAALAGVVALVLVAVALTGVRLPDVVVAVLAAVLAVTTARAAWATLAVVSARLWDLLAVCLVCLLAFGLAVSGLAHWHSPADDEGKGSGIGPAVNSAVAGFVVALLILIGGAGIARFQEEGRGPAGPPQKVAGLLSIRAADAAVTDDLAGPWVPQVAAQQIGDDDAAATAFSVAHRGWTGRFPALLVRGDDVEGDLGDSWWLTVAAQGFGSQVEAEQWCATNAVAGCVPVQLDD